MLSCLQNTLEQWVRKAYGCSQPMSDLTYNLLYELQPIPAWVAKDQSLDSPETKVKTTHLF